MKKNFISFPESLEASKRSICAVMISSYPVRCALIFFPLWRGNTALQQCFFLAKAKCAFEQNTQNISILSGFFFFFHFYVTNILSLRDTCQVNTKEVNTNKSKLNYCLKPLLALLISLRCNTVVVVSSLGRKQNQSRRMCAPPKFMLI